MEGRPRAPGGAAVKRWAGYPVVFMVVLATVYGAAVSAVAVATRDRVEAGARARLRGHVLAAFGLPVPADPLAVDRAWAAAVAERADDRGSYFEAKGPDGAILGFAFPFGGPGFWGPIRGVLAVDPRGERILGLSFTEHRETPGLGGRIAEPWFRDQFKGQAPGALTFVSRPPRGPGEVEAITGATQTSTRLAAFLNPFLVGLKDRAPLRAGGGG